MKNAGKRNYQKELDTLLSTLAESGRRPALLLHSCCAPCSSYTLEYLSRFFDITVYYYDPNLYPAQEFERRRAEQARLIDRFNAANPAQNKIHFLPGAYEPERFDALARGFEDEPERGKRCLRCYRLRLEETAKRAREKGFDYFATTLTISPQKRAADINAIGEAVGKKYGVRYLDSDFKKRDGYRRSVELSKRYDLYRQDYCGCIFSKRDAERRKAAREGNAPSTGRFECRAGMARAAGRPVGKEKESEE